jgi:hypothetical protein
MALVCEWVVRIGYRNIAYVVFVSLLVPFGALMEAVGSKRPDADPYWVMGSAAPRFQIVAR